MVSCISDLLPSGLRGCLRGSQASAGRPVGSLRYSSNLSRVESLWTWRNIVVNSKCSKIKSPFACFTWSKIFSTVLCDSGLTWSERIARIWKYKFCERSFDTALNASEREFCKNFMISYQKNLFYLFGNLRAKSHFKKDEKSKFWPCRPSWWWPGPGGPRCRSLPAPASSPSERVLGSLHLLWSFCKK